MSMEIYHKVFKLPYRCPTEDMKAKLTNARAKAYEPAEKLYDVYDTEIAGFVLRVRPTGNKTYFLFYRNKDGKKRTYKIGSGLTATQARDIAQRVNGDIKNGIDPNQRDSDQRQEAQRLAKTTFSVFLEEVYKDWLIENRKSGYHTYRRLRGAFDTFNSTQVDRISSWDMERWRRVRKQGGASDGTVKNDVAELKAMLNRSRQWGFIQGHQLGDYKLPRAASVKIVRYLSDNEYVRLCEALEARELARQCDRQSANVWRAERGYELYPIYTGYTDHLMPMVLLALNTGMRRKEIFTLLWSDIDLKTKTICIRSEIAKSKSKRYIPMNDSLQEVLEIWHTNQQDATGLVFPNADGKSFDNIYKAWSGLLINARIENFRFHDLRHNFASQLVMKGVDLYTVKELLGHSTITVTERYAHLAPKKLADAVNLL